MNINESDLKHVLDRLGFYSPRDEHTKDTPRRLLKYLQHWSDAPEWPPFKMTVFPNTDPYVDEMIIVPNIPFWSCCSHHLLPFFGEVSVAYIPDKLLIGLSKVAQIVRWRAKRPQVQEHLAHEIANYLEALLNPDGLGVYIRAWHTCQMLSVGPGAPQMVTTVVRGKMLNAPAKAEFLREVK